VFRGFGHVEVDSVTESSDEVNFNHYSLFACETPQRERDLTNFCRTSSLRHPPLSRTLVSRVIPHGEMYTKFAAGICRLGNANPIGNRFSTRTQIIYCRFSNQGGSDEESSDEEEEPVALTRLSHVFMRKLEKE
jgi:hypothetical protein